MSQPRLEGKDQPRVTVWFDGDCPLCRAEISLYQQLDQKAGRIAFVDLTGDGTCPINRADMLARFHAQEAGGPLISGAKAFAAMWRQVTPFQPLGYLAQLPLILPFLDWLYGQFLKVRPRLQSLMVDREKRQG
ncbi:MAG: thiol-disulfide oxidoreductase [Alphaproteobacteria bacterium PA3]|nr:MAG: thiol-disulfide oxidoreductase [Alphaproteobacteria bacterium PA3]